MRDEKERRVAVLLTVHNRREKTLECLKRLHGQVPVDGVGVDVWLTDDGCTDGTPEAVAQQFPTVNIVRGDGSLFWNRGMIAAWEAAARACDYDYYLWLNDDTMLHPDALARLLACSGRVRDNSPVVGSCHATGNPADLTYGASDGSRLIQPSPDKPLSCVTFNGNIVLVPRSVYQRLGTLDPYYRHSVGDYDYGYRAREAGIVNRIAPGFYGACDRHERVAVWRDPSMPFSKRWRDFKSPTGNNLRECFRFRRRHFGIATAVMFTCSNLLHVAFPRLWTASRQHP